MTDPADDQTIELISQRVIAAVRKDLEILLAEVSGPAANEQLTVGQVAQRLGVARSTVYAHWRDWGGYKLGPGTKAPIRFDIRALPTVTERAHAGRVPEVGPPRPRRRPRRRGRDLLADAPRLVQPLDGPG
jgi:hypothetical protein